MADTMNIIAAHRLTGGTQWSLDWFPIASLIDQDKAVVTDGTNIYFFEFDADSVLAEDVVTHPYKVRPDDFATQGVWIEQQTVGGGGGSGTVTSVSVVSANGISGSVANPTTTPAITLTLGAITPSTVNGLTLTAQATGFTIAGGTTSKTLTLSGDATIDGTEIKTTSQVTALSATASGDKDKYLHSNASTGVLEWSTVSLAQYWQENATVLSPTTAGNTVSIPLLNLQTTPTTAFTLTNTTPATDAVKVQMTPVFMLGSQVWNTSASEASNWFIMGLPTSAATPTSLLKIGYQRAAGSLTYPMTLSNGGDLTLLGNITVPNSKSLICGSGSDYGYITFENSSISGVYITRNRADALAVFSINNKHASSTGGLLRMMWKNENRLIIQKEGNISAPHADGIMIGISTSEKLAFWGATPMAQPSAIANATGSGGGDAHTQLNLLLAQLRLMGLIAAA